MRYRDELQHHGIIGQKWGVRRFQNSDGSYTNAGKKRYSGSSDKKSKANSSTAKMSKELIRKQIELGKWSKEHPNATSEEVSRKIDDIYGANSAKKVQSYLKDESARANQALNDIAMQQNEEFMRQSIFFTNQAIAEHQRIVDQTIQTNMQTEINNQILNNQMNNSVMLSNQMMFGF